MVGKFQRWVPQLRGDGRMPVDGDLQQPRSTRAAEILPLARRFPGSRAEVFDLWALTTVFVHCDCKARR